MILKVTLKSKEENINLEPIAIEFNDNILYVSLMNVIESSQDGELKLNPQGKVILQLEDRRLTEIPFEDKKPLYDLHELLYKNKDNIIDIVLISSITGDILFSMDALKYNIDSIKLEDKSFSDFILERNLNALSLFFQIIFSLKEEE